MQQLPKRCQTLLMVILGSENRTYYEISAALEIPVGSIGPTRSRCLKRLRELVETMGLRDDDILATEASLVRTLQETPQIMDTVPPEVVEDAVRAREIE